MSAAAEPGMNRQASVERASVVGPASAGCRKPAGCKPPEGGPTLTGAACARREPSA